MKKTVKVFAGMEFGRRLFAGLVTLLLVLTLIGGIEAFVPVSELNELDDAVSIDAVLAQEQLSERSSVVARVGSARADTQRLLPTSFDVLKAESAPVKGQVVFMLRNSGIQRAVPPTGPPFAQA